MALNYSLSEQLTSETWINGKPIYQKTIDFGAIPNAAEKRVAHGINNLDYVVDIQSVAKSNDEVQIPAAQPSALALERNQGIAITPTHIFIENRVNRSHYTAYVTLRYTKN